jgi:DNA-binding CsgD family transcriptional regulator
MEGKRIRILLVLLLPGFILCYPAFSQSFIQGQIRIDTTRWAPVAYLSAIPDFTQLYSISNEAIIQRSPVDSLGRFRFDCQVFPVDERLYRIHFSKKGDPAASLIIGGQDENHLFLVANNHAEVGIRIFGSQKLMDGISFTGYAPNRALLEINQIAGFLDTLDYYGPAVNRDFVRQAVYDRLRSYADTCSNPLISLYAIYKSRFETDAAIHPDFYRKYLRRWRNETSDYFTSFRSELPPEALPSRQVGWIAAIGAMLAVIIGLTGFRYFRRHRSTKGNGYQSLSVQERRVFALMKEGRSNKEISEECAISLSTVKSHVNSIYSKLGIKSRTDAMDYR